MRDSNIFSVKWIQFNQVTFNGFQNSIPRKRTLIQKSEDNFRLSYDIYEILRFSKSQFCVKDLWIKMLEDHWNISECLPACLPVCLPACLPACLTTCLPACLLACLSACLATTT